MLSKIINRLRLTNQERILVPSMQGYGKHVVRRFRLIDKEIASAHAPLELLFVAQAILNSKIPGSIIECGSYLGASAAKLSVVARITGRTLYVCDSFCGLPEQYGTETHQKIPGGAREFRAGEYRGTLEQVQKNIRQFGEIDACRFVPGFFEDSLATLDVTPAFVFMDVDYVRSAYTCLRFLWPRLAPGGLFYTHEAIFDEFVRGITDDLWWHANLQQGPPLLYGAGYGLHPLAQYLAYFKKGPDGTPVQGGDIL